MCALLTAAAACGDSSGPSEPTPLAVAAVPGTVPQTAVAGTVVPTPPSVRVVDAGGAGVPGVAVTFSVTSGGGSVQGGSATTDANGVASVTSWTLGTTAGANLLTARVAKLAPVTFTATGVAGVATQLTRSSADPSSTVVGTAVAAAPSVTARDANGNPVPGVPVTFAIRAGGGTITGVSVSTAANGVATLGSWTVGTIVGQNSVAATSPGLADVVISLTSIPGPPVSISVTPDPASVAVGGTLQIAATGLDKYGNPITNLPAAYAVSGGSNASISANGLVTGVALGKTSIVATSGALSKTVSVFVGGIGGSATRVDAPETGAPFGLGLSSKGTLLVGEPSNNKVGRYDLPSTSLKTTIAVGADPDDVAFSLDGSTAYVTNVVSGSVSVIDVASNVETSRIPVPGPAYRLVMSPDGTKLYVTTANGYLSTIALPSGLVSSISIGGTLNGIALHPTQPLLFVSSTTGVVSEVSRTTGQMTRSIQIGGTAQEVVVSAEGTQLFVVNESGALEVRSTATLALQSTVPIAGAAFGAAITPDNAQLWVSRPSAGTVMVLDRATMTLLRTYSGGSPRRIIFDRTGATAVIANEAGYVTFIR